MFRNSLKTRLALSYALLFFVSCLIIMTLCSYLVYQLLNNAYDANAERIARRSAELHLLGRRTGSFNEILNGSEYPEEERKILEEKFPGTTILFTGYRFGSSGPGDKTRYYTAFALQGGEYCEMRLLSNGGVYRKKIYPEHNKSSLRNYFSNLLLNRGQENFGIAVFEKNDALYLESHKNAVPFEILKKLQQKPAPQNIDKFRYALFHFADGRKVVIATGLNQRLAYLANITSIGAILLVCMTAAGALIAWFLTRRFIRGVKETTLAMNRISSGDYSFRLRESTDHDREIQELTATFNAMNERTENLLKELRTVSDNVAHDLRTPLTRISGTVELMLTRKDLPEDIWNDCVSVAEEISRLKELVNTIMEISRTNAAPGTLQRTHFDLTAVTADFCEFMQVAFEEKGLEFTLQLTEGKIFIDADKNMFQRLLSNLLGNALKFTDRGFVAVEICREGALVRLSVADSGCGIPHEDQSQVFKRFFRSDTSRHLQGNGLGLSLVKAIVKAHKWQIELASTPGEGSLFTVSIPTAQEQ